MLILEETPNILGHRQKTPHPKQTKDGPAHISRGGGPRHPHWEFARRPVFRRRFTLGSVTRGIRRSAEAYISSVRPPDERGYDPKTHVAFPETSGGLFRTDILIWWRGEPPESVPLRIVFVSPH